MYCTKILVGTNDVIVTEYLVQVHPDLSLVLDGKGVRIMDDLKILEFIPYSNILNVVNISSNDENIFFVTYAQY